ncbi:hypothetical protein AG1IA_05370 [Rhizoctonia solani AG-1 IA]|uniref:Uncharacterized protein n=1 Tax=Thanatephorus cucumeris (strain AG1-IA) TaxID=983506 RepID=L8WR35_THACA|nr:hypothetical protein AG1IA_05370 [Rhizoctonia solani AG-1 IA]
MVHNMIAQQTPLKQTDTDSTVRSQLRFWAYAYPVDPLGTIGY